MSAKNIAIVTGANGGLGKEFVRLLNAENGIDEIWAIARNQEKLHQLTVEFGSKIRTFSLDLTDRASIGTLSDALSAADANVRWLINNAGFAKFCAYNDISIDESLNMIDLNISAVVAVGLAVLPRMRQGAHILNIASQASFQPLPYQNLYSSTKAFVRNYTRALNMELRDRGITATAVCPGWMKTDLFSRGDVGAAKATTHFTAMVTPDVVARKALHDAKRGRDMSVYSLYVKTAHLMAKLLPQRAMMRVWLMQQGLK